MGVASEQHPASRASLLTKRRDAHTHCMELDRDTWLLASRRVRRVARLAWALWWTAWLVLVLAVFGFPGLGVVTVVIATVALFLVHRIVLSAGAGHSIRSMTSTIRASGLTLSPFQVTQLLKDGMTPGGGTTWMTTYDGSAVRLVGESREPGDAPRSSSPWVWAMPPGM